MFMYFQYQAALVIKNTGSATRIELRHTKLDVLSSCRKVLHFITSFPLSEYSLRRVVTINRDDHMARS